MAIRTRLLWLVLLGSIACSESGQVLGPPDDRSSQPPRLAASALSAGVSHTCALFSGEAACWGLNARGQLGLGDQANRSQPTRLNSRALRQIAGGEHHTCAIDAADDLYCWGANDRGQLGIGSRQDVALPTLVELAGRAAQVSAGFAHTCVLLTDGSLWCFGQNGEGELGQGDAFPPSMQEALARDALSPVQIAGSWRGVDAGQGHTCATRSDGALFCWGRNSSGQLGMGGEEQYRTPMRVGSDLDWEVVDAGQQHTCALRADGSLWCWGENTGAPDAGFPLGVSGTLVRTPARVGPSNAWRSLSTHSFHTCALDAAFDLYCWGRNREGQLGTGDTDIRQSPGLVGASFAAVASARFHTCAVRRDGSVACSGENEAGQLGNGTAERSARFADVAPP